MAEDKAQEAVQVFEFAKTITPLPIEVDNTPGRYIQWGVDNNYPVFLLKLFEEVSLHASITTSKVDYLIGDGMVNKADSTPYTFKISLSQTPEEFANRVAFDLVLFGWFAVKVQRNAFGKGIYVAHHPANEVRTNKSMSKFWTSENWVEATKIFSYDAYTGVEDNNSDTQMFVYKPYVPAVNKVYPSIKYKSAITEMVTAILVKDDNKTGLEEGFSGEAIVNFFKGLPDSVQGKLFTDKFKKAHSGTKGSKIIIDFNNPPTDGMPSTETKINTIDKPDSTARIDSINGQIEQAILTAHQATSRGLFGIEQAVGLNGTELETAFQVFNKVYVRNNRNVLEAGINKLFAMLGFAPCQLKDTGAMLPKSLADATKEKVYTKDELRNIDGMPKLPDGSGGSLLEQPKALFTKDAQFAAIDPKRPVGRKLVEEDFILVQDLGVSREAFSLLDEYEDTAENFRAVELYFDDAADIENYLLENDLQGKTIAQIRTDIRKELGISVTTKELDTKINRLIQAGVLEDSKVAKKGASSREVQTLYAYDVRPGYGEVIIPGSRSFCRKLIANDRYYSREDIQKMSAIFGYDVFTHCGGWYFNDKTNEAESQCRHYFKTVRVIKK